MFLKLNGKTYRGSVCADREHPVIEVNDEELADYLVGNGFFSVTETPAETNDEDTGTRPDFERMATMNKAELTAYAEELGVDISGAKTKADIMKEISVAFGGSRTMIELCND